MLSKEIILGLNQKERLDLRVEEKDDVTSAIKQVTMQGSALIERTHTGTMIKIPLMENQRNDKFNSKGKRRAGNRGRGQPFKKARNSRMY